MADAQRHSLDEVILHFAVLEVTRSTVNLEHPLVSVIVIALMAEVAAARASIIYKCSLLMIYRAARVAPDPATRWVIACFGHKRWPDQ
jgi:hypothetical protein